MSEAVTLILVNGKPLSTNDVLVELKSSGEYKKSIDRLIKTFALKDYATNNKLEVTDDELQNYVTDKRKELRLFSMDDLNRYVANFGINADQWIDSLEVEFLSQKIKDSIFTDLNIQNYYKENQFKYTIIYLFQIKVENKALAEELLLEAKSDGADFSSLAKKYSKDEDTAEIGGFYGKIKRGETTPDLENKLFNAEKGDYVGPIASGDDFIIYYIENKFVQTLNDDLKAEIKDTMFEMWQSQLVQSTKLQAPQ